MLVTQSSSPTTLHSSSSYSFGQENILCIVFFSPQNGKLLDFQYISTRFSEQRIPRPPPPSPRCSLMRDVSNFDKCYICITRIALSKVFYVQQTTFLDFERSKEVKVRDLKSVWSALEIRSSHTQLEGSTTCKNDWTTRFKKCSL